MGLVGSGLKFDQAGVGSVFWLMISSPSSGLIVSSGGQSSATRAPTHERSEAMETCGAGGLRAEPPKQALTWIGMPFT